MKYRRREVAKHPPRRNRPVQPKRNSFSLLGLLAWHLRAPAWRARNPRQSRRPDRRAPARKQGRRYRSKDQALANPAAGELAVDAEPSACATLGPARGTAND